MQANSPRQDLDAGLALSPSAASLYTMLVACGSPSMLLLLPVGAFVLFVLANAPVGLAALTAALCRPGREFGAIRRMGATNIATGLCVLPFGLMSTPVAIFGASLVFIGIATRAANRFPPTVRS